MMCLGDMKVEVTDGDATSSEPSHRLFHRKLLETDELDEVRTLWALPIYSTH